MSKHEQAHGPVQEQEQSEAVNDFSMDVASRTLIDAKLDEWLVYLTSNGGEIHVNVIGNYSIPTGLENDFAPEVRIKKTMRFTIYDTAGNKVFTCPDFSL